MRRWLALGVAGAALAAAVTGWSARAAEPKPGAREPIPSRKSPGTKQPSEPALQAPPSASSQGQPEQAAVAGPFFVDVVCDGQQLALETQGANERKRSVKGSHAGGVQKWTLCAKAGWLAYQWSFTDLDPAENQGRLYLADVNGRHARLVMEAPLPAYERSAAGGALFAEGKLSVQASQPTPAGSAAGLPASRTIDLVVRVSADDVPIPGMTSYWIDEYRPGRSGVLREQGILDPAALAAPDPSDGIVHVEGRSLNQPPVEIYIARSGGVRHAGTVLERSSQGRTDRMKVRFSGFRAGEFTLRNAWAGTSTRVPRLFYRALDAETLDALTSGLAIVVGTPVGEGLVKMGESERRFEVAAFQQGGADVNVVDLRSSSVSFGFLPGAKPGTVTLRMLVGFETAGEEIRGTWRAAEGAPAVDIGGHLTSPQLEIRAQLGVGRNGASVAGSYLETTFSAGIQLTAAGVGFPLGPLEQHVLKRVNQGLLGSMTEMKMAESLAGSIDQSLPRDPASRIRELAHHEGKLFVDMAEP